MFKYFKTLFGSPQSPTGAGASTADQITSKQQHLLETSNKKNPKDQSDINNVFHSQLDFDDDDDCGESNNRVNLHSANSSPATPLLLAKLEKQKKRELKAHSKNIINNSGADCNHDQLLLDYADPDNNNNQNNDDDEQQSQLLCQPSIGNKRSNPEQDSQIEKEDLETKSMTKKRQNCSQKTEQEDDIDLELGLLEGREQLDGITCAICMDLIVNARTAVCGHSFCADCINESLIRKKDCPHCRKDIRSWTLQKNPFIDRAVEMMVKAKTKATDDDSEQKRWEQRIEQSQNWIKKHQVDFESLQAGNKLDVLDTEYIWCVAGVELKISQVGADSNGDTCKPLLLVHYDGWSRKFDEFLSLNSNRIAPHGLYTSREDIPRYRMCPRQVQASGGGVNMAHVVENRREEQQYLNAHENRASAAGAGAGAGAAAAGSPANRHPEIQSVIDRNNQIIARLHHQIARNGQRERAAERERPAQPAAADAQQNEEPAGQVRAIEPIEERNEQSEQDSVHQQEDLPPLEEQSQQNEQIEQNNEQVDEPLQIIDQSNSVEQQQAQPASSFIQQQQQDEEPNPEPEGEGQQNDPSQN